MKKVKQISIALLVAFLFIFSACENPSGELDMDNDEPEVVTDIDLATLTAAITAADKLKSDTGVGTEPGQVPATASYDFSDVIGAAIAVRDNAGRTQAEMNTAYENLIAATDTFNAAVITSDFNPDLDFAALDSAIAAANLNKNGTGVGESIGMVPDGTYITTYVAAIFAAESVRNSAASQSVVDQALVSLNEATDTFNAAKIAPPDPAVPVITLLGETTISLLVGETYTDAGATATDAVDGDITTDIVVVGDTFDTSVAGTYYVTYNVTDSDFNDSIEVVRIVIVSLPMADPAAPATAPTEAELSSAIVIYTDTVLPSGATQASLGDWEVFEGETVRSEIIVDGNAMWKFECSAINRIALNLAAVIDISGATRIHFDIYSVGNAAQPAGPDGITPNEFKLEFKSGDTEKNTTQLSAQTPDTWVNVDKLISECNFGGANVDTTSISSITFNEYLSNRPVVPSGFYIDNLYFY